jgi:UDP-galactopyranose mutase
LLTRIGSEHIQWPIPQSYIIRTVGAAWKPSFCNKPQNFEEAALSIMPEPIYRLFVKEYTEKQWGVPCKTLCASLCKRFDVRIDDEPRLTPTCKYQGIPSSGYADWMRSILDGIPIMLNFDYLREPEMITVNRCTVYTGPIDEYFGFSLGRLAYRGQHREHSYIADCRYTQPCGQVNNPTHAGGPHIRTLEWKHMMDPVFANQVTGTVLTRETPFSPTSPGEYEYPFPDDRNAALYANYRRRADSLDSVVIAGRLGEYRYYDMDQAIGRALNLASQLLDR